MTRHSIKPNKLRNVNPVRGSTGNVTIQKWKIYYIKIKVIALFIFLLSYKLRVVNVSLAFIVNQHCFIPKCLSLQVDAKNSTCDFYSNVLMVKVKGQYNQNTQYISIDIGHKRDVVLLINYIT